GLVAACLARRGALRRRWDLAIVVALFPLAELALLHLSAYRVLKLTIGGRFPDPVVTGRYLIVLLAFFRVALAFAVSALPRRLQPAATGLLLGAGVLLSTSGLALTAARFYA